MTFPTSVSNCPSANGVGDGLREVTPSSAKDLLTDLCRQLESEVRQLEAPYEDHRNHRQECATMFEHFDQKTNQLFNIPSTALKSMKEMEASVVRNLN